MRGFNSTKVGEYSTSVDDQDVDYYLGKINKKLEDSLNRSVMHKVAVSQKIKQSLGKDLNEIKT